MSEVSAGSVWINGELVDAAAATVSVFDHGLTVGDGVFETMKVVAKLDTDTDTPGPGTPGPGTPGTDLDTDTDTPGPGTPGTGTPGTGTPGPGTPEAFEAFALDRHLVRLRRSVAVMGLPLAVDDGVLRDAVAAVIEANGGPMGGAGRIRITVTGGGAPLGSDRGTSGPSVIVAAGPAPRWARTSHVVTVPWLRNEHAPTAGVKTTSYADNVVALHYAKELGGDEAIFANTAGNLCEGTGSNVFVVIDGRLVTPPLTSGCLAGITRALVLEWLGASPQSEITEVGEEDLALEALAAADEAFLTSSTRDIQPIATVDGVALPASPGPVTTAAMARFAAQAR